MRIRFENNVEVLMTETSDNYGRGWEETSICYPVLGDWELVVGFEVDESKPVADWAINYIGHNRIVANGMLEVVDWAAGYGHKLGTQTVSAMLPDKGLYVEHFWRYRQLMLARDVAAENCMSISEGISEIEYQLEDLTSSSGRRQALSGELASLKDDLDKANEVAIAAGHALEEFVGEDPTFLVID